MEEILLRSLNLHAQAKLTQLRDVLLADESLGMLPEHITVTVQPGQINKEVLCGKQIAHMLQR
jgi:hypothetical protein